ncbi:hypothetical protein [Estrella lausannensis]|uniref:Uncharacterized protein n=1 Tax=Estrella lausannensis TaxID=483423 RepID=A0A0H5E607_9BACT|nr:hypothetical protein [Estrella lausannensis]CRX38675.1 hypothetical protein ELAC_1336 [Estrella lausannensis]
MDPQVTLKSPIIFIDDYKIPALKEIVRTTQVLKGPVHILIQTNEYKEKIEEALTIGELAVQRFSHLPDEAKFILFEMKVIIEEKSRDQEFMSRITENPLSRKLHDRMVEIFVGRLYGKSLPGKVFDEPLTIKTLSSDDKMREAALKAATYEEEALFEKIDQEFDLIKSTLSQDPITARAIERKRKIVAVISGFFTRFIKEYYPYFFPKGDNDQGVDLSKYLLKNFESLFPEVIPHLFFSWPAAFGKDEMAIVIGLFKEAVLFLHDYNDALSHYQGLSAEFEKAMPQEKELLLLNWLKENRLKEEMFQKLESSKTGLMHLIGTLLEDTLFLSLPKETKQSSNPAILRLIISMTAGHLLPVLNRFLSEDVFTFAIKRFLTGDSLQIDPELEGVNEKAFGKGNDEFDKRLAVEIENFSNEIMRLGHASKGLSAVQKIAMSFKERIAAMIQLKIRVIYSSDAMILPILVLNHLLFDKEKPICLHYFRQEIKEQKIEEEKLREELGLLIRAKIKEMTEGPAFSIAMALTSIESFTDELGRAVVDLVHRPLLVRLLIVYLLRGLNQGLRLRAETV